MSRGSKIFLSIVLIALLTLGAGEALLFFAGFPTGVQIHETDLRTFDEQLVYRLRPDITLKEKRTPYFVHPEIRTNSLGLRDSEVALPKPPGVFRILSLGDSYAFGWGVAVEQTYGKRLEKLLQDALPGKRIEVVNGGVPSYESWRELGLLRRLGPLLQPDLVLCQVADNDLGPDGARWRHAESPFPSWLLRAARSSRLATVLVTLASTGLEGVREMRAHAAGQDTVARSQEWMDRYMKELAEGNDSSFQHRAPWTDGIISNYDSMNAWAHGSFVCILLPNRYQIYGAGYRDTALSAIATMLSQRGVRGVDLWPYLRARSREPLCLSDSHPNALGHQYIADTLLAYLRTSGMLH